MRFWDSSAIAPLIVEEVNSAHTQSLIGSDPAITVWWATEVECAAAITRHQRAGLTDDAAATAFERLDRAASIWNEIHPVPDIRRTARRLLRVHPLRAADALQLAAAILGSERDPTTQEFVCLDDRLLDAASREGFVVVDPRNA